MMNANLVVLYSVTTKRLTEQVKRNADRFPGDFMYQLNTVEKAEVVAWVCVLRTSRPRPSSPGW